MSLRGSMRRKVILGAFAPLAAAIMIGTALPAGASPSAAPADAQRGSGVTATTPFCIVQGAVMYPLFIGMVMLLNPTAITSAPSEYWNGGDHSRGQLKTCGI